MNPSSRYWEQTTAEPNTFKQAIIINPIHPLYGKHVTVRKMQRLRPDYVDVSVDHPDGGGIAVPLTDLIPATEEFFDVAALNADQANIFELKNLLCLAKLIHVRLTRSK